MNDESKNETIDGQNLGAEKKRTFRQRILSWLGYAALIAAMLFFFAPDSWWQFGVTPANNRKMSSNFRLEGIDGKAWNFGEQRGKVTVVNYWATWCPPCRVETPGLVNIADEYKERGVEMVGVTMDEDLALVPPFIEKYQMKYAVLLPGNDPNLASDAITLPTTFLYDKNGRLAKKYTGIVLESTLRSDVETLLAEK